MGFRNFIATTLTGLMLSGGNPSGDSLEEKIVEREDLPYPEFSVTYSAEPMNTAASTALGIGRATRIVRFDDNISFRSYQHNPGGITQVLEGKADINIRVGFMKWKFDIGLISLIDEKGRTLKSIAYNKGSTDFMNGNTKRLALELEKKGLLEGSENITSLYVDVFDWANNIVYHTGRNDTTYNIRENSHCLLALLMHYTSSVKEKNDRDFVNVFLFGERHLLPVRKYEEEDYYRIHVRLTRTEMVDGRVKNVNIMDGLNSLEIYVSKDEINNNNYVLPFKVEADARVNGRAVRE